MTMRKYCGLVVAAIFAWCVAAVVIAAAAWGAARLFDWLG